MTGHRSYSYLTSLFKDHPFWIIPHPFLKFYRASFLETFNFFTARVKKIAQWFTVGLRKTNAEQLICHEAAIQVYYTN